MSGWSIDRIEEGWAVCEGPDDEMIRLEVSRLPAGVREGDCLVCVDGSWQIDREETLRRRQQNHSRTAGLFRRKSREQSE